MNQKFRIKEEAIEGVVRYYPQYRNTAGISVFNSWYYYPTYKEGRIGEDAGSFATKEEAKAFLDLKQPKNNYTKIIDYEPTV